MRKLLILAQLLRRDCYVYVRSARDDVINYALIYPTMYALAFGYIQAQSYFGYEPERATMLFAGNILVPLMVLTYNKHIELFFDLQGPKFINYQLMLLPSSWLIARFVIFAGFYAFVVAIPFFPISKLLLQNNIDTQYTSWMLVYIMLFFSTMCASAYHLLAAVWMTNTAQISSLWARINNTAISLGGFWIPWLAIYTFSPTFGYTMLINPLVYMTEGLRRAILGSSAFFAIPICVVVLAVFTLFLSIIAYYVFKRRLDPVT